MHTLTNEQEAIIVQIAERTAAAFVAEWKRPIQLHSSGVGLDWEHIAWEADCREMHARATLSGLASSDAGLHAWTLYKATVKAHSASLCPSEVKA